MLTIVEVQEYLSHVTSRPGWTFEAYQGDFEGVHVRIVASKVEDSYNPGEFVDLGVTSHLPPMINIRALELWLVWRLGRIDNHETREWFKYDGVPVFDPHGEGAEDDRGQI